MGLSRTDGRSSLTCVRKSTLRSPLLPTGLGVRQVDPDVRLRHAPIGKPLSTPPGPSRWRLPSSQRIIVIRSSFRLEARRMILETLSISPTTPAAASRSRTCSRSIVGVGLHDGCGWQRPLLWWQFSWSARWPAMDRDTRRPHRASLQEPPSSCRHRWAARYRSPQTERRWLSGYPSVSLGCFSPATSSCSMIWLPCERRDRSGSTLLIRTVRWQAEAAQQSTARS